MVLSLVVRLVVPLPQHLFFFPKEHIKILVAVRLTVGADVFLVKQKVIFDIGFFIQPIGAYF